MIIRTLKQTDLPQMIGIIESQYHEERSMVKSLPAYKDVATIIKKTVERFFEIMDGAGLFDDQRLIAFMMGYEMGVFWGNQKGVLIPLYGHGSVYENRRNNLQRIYRHMAQVWVDEGWVSHAVKIHAHDPESMAAWFQLGFGNRCIDAIKIVEQNQNQAHHLRIKKASKDDLEDLLDIKKDFGGYFESSPMFMKASLEDAKNNILDWLEKDNHHQWILYQKEALVGMIKIEPNGETLISRRDDTMNITGIYVKEAFRHMGLGKYLLDWLDNWLYKAGYRKCGVDYESFNIKGSNFWEKCFSPYTRTLSRRIDEEILEK